MKTKKTFYRHPVTNKFISKKDWEALQEIENIPYSQIVEIETTEDLMKELEEQFEKDLELNNSPTKGSDYDVDEGAGERGIFKWKIFTKKLKSWL